ncbi:MAG: endonuclease/exonuclease/phosphatase [Alphaproteobacteria bacterium]|nr:endonuclease/exonuclease/phosphatase [Alphaproteobacteria bacterium]
MAEMFTEAEWAAIRTELAADPVKYGLPTRQYGSVLIASFNIRKLGKLGAKGRDDATMAFLADVCRRFDLVAVQEVMSDMTALRRMRDLMGARYGLAVSDIVGTFPGERGNEERLAFIYNPALVRRAELVTSVSTSRTKVLKTLARHHKEIFNVMDNSADAEAQRKYITETVPEYHRKLDAGERPRAPKEPRFKVNVDPFLQFIREPFAVAFEVHGHPGLDSYNFLAVNAHLQFGRMKDRKAEARAIFEWIIHKVESAEARNIVVLGDLNFDLNRPREDLKEIITEFKKIRRSGKNKNMYVSFPFIFPHPRPPGLHPPGDVYRTNIRLNQTYDQIGVFSRDDQVGKHLETTYTGHGDETNWGEPNYPDYGVFNFSDLFSVALNGKPLSALTKSKRTAFIKRFEHKVSDHMPIWYRVPLPLPQQSFPEAVQPRA